MSESREVDIYARRRWNRTGVHVTRGQRLEFAATGCWIDLFIPHGPAGDPSDLEYMRWFERFRRVPDSDWFTLMGAVDQDPATVFRIGKGCIWTAPRHGEITCFANDLPWFYWNNFGAVRLRITPAL